MTLVINEKYQGQILSPFRVTLMLGNEATNKLILDRRTECSTSYYHIVTISYFVLSISVGVDVMMIRIFSDNRNSKSKETLCRFH